MAYPATIQIDYATPYETGTTQQYPIGQRAETPNGDVFRYTLMGGTIGVANKLYQSSIPVANWTTQTHTIEATAGDTSISFDSGTNFAVNQAAGGTVLFEETDDFGDIYRIKSNAATVATETIMQFEDGVTVQTTMPVAANNVMTFILNPWSAVIITPVGDNTAPSIGVPRVIIAVNGYGWLQTRGITSCLVEDDGQPPLTGNEVRASQDVAGAFSLRDETAEEIDEMPIGFCVDTAPTADFGHIYLQID